MTEQAKTTTPIDDVVERFDTAMWDKRYQAGTRNDKDGKGFIAVVMEYYNPDDLTRKRKAFDSLDFHGKVGRFAEIEQAKAYAERRKLAMIDLHRQTHNTRIRRSMALADKLQALSEEEKKRERERKSAAARIKQIEIERGVLIDEAKEPELELTLQPSSRGWRIDFAPNLSEGSPADHERQMVIEQTGLEPIVPAAEEKWDDAKAPAPPTALHVVNGADAPTEPPGPASEDGGSAGPGGSSGRKMPSSVQGRDGARVKLGGYCTASGPGRKGNGHEGWLVAINRDLPDGKYEVTVVPADGGSPIVVSSAFITKARKPRGSRAPQWPPPEAVTLSGMWEHAKEAAGVPDREPPANETPGGTVHGIDPSKVRWPEDDGQ